jgi:cytoskeleton protein RodZ
MIPVGETLRRERLRRNLSLEQISREIKIAPRMLEAIEAEQFDKLPGGVFAKSFVRQYARMLGLDEEQLATEVQHTLTPEPAEAEPSEKFGAPKAPKIQVAPMAEWESVGGDRKRTAWLPALALVVLVMLVCSAVYTWWQRSRRQPEPVTIAQQTQPQPPAAPAPGSEAPPPAAAPPTAEPQPAPASARPEPAASAPQEAAPSESSRNDTPPTLPQAQPQPPAAAAPANPNANVRVQLTAEEPTWIRVTSDGKYVFSGTLEAKQSRTVEAAGTVGLRLGNAGGVGVTLNGKPLGPIGPKGQIREVQITPEGFQVVSRKPPAAPLNDPL